MSAPLITVVIPVFNLGAYLDEAVQSVQAQTFQDFEILIIDDGSTEPATRALLDRYQAPKTEVIRVERNQGLARTRNLGISRARGTHLCALDADDRLAPEYFAKTVAAFEKDPGLTFVSSWLHTFGDESWLWKQERCDLAMLLAEDTVHTAALVRLDAVRNVGGYDDAMGEMGYEDWDLWLSLVERGYRGTILQEVLFHYRRRAGSMSALCARGEGHLKLMRYLLTKHRDSYQRHLFSVLEHRDKEVGRLLAENWTEERRLAMELEPGLRRKREELARLTARLESAEVREELERARQEVAALRTSLSWRVTGPGRAAFDAWQRWRRRT